MGRRGGFPPEHARAIDFRTRRPPPPGVRGKRNRRAPTCAPADTMGRRGGFPSESAHAIYFTIVVLSPPPRRVKAMMMMIRMTAPTRAQSLQSDTNSDDVLVVVV